MYICPYCGKPGIGYIRKQFIASWLPATCRACGNKVQNHALRAVLSALPFIACVIGSGSVADISFSYVVIAAGLLSMLFLNAFWVPLEKDKVKK